MDDKPKNEARVRAGKARAQALTPEERKEIARNAARARWDADVPTAGHEGDFEIGSSTVNAAVLENGKRLLTQATFLRAIGRARSPKAGTGVLSTVDGLPFFLQADVLQPFISDDLRVSTTPIFYKSLAGKRGVGYDAELLPKVCEVYLKYRDHQLSRNKKVPSNYDHIVRASDIVMRGLAHVGIVALVDEATGYQDIRDRRALQAILDTFLRKEFAAWARRFPPEFYREIFRLRGWQWRGMKVNRPQVVAHYTNNIVYERLAPGILDELRKRNPKTESGRRRSKHHQWLTEDFGHPALAQHIHASMGLMRASKSWDQFMDLLEAAFPKQGTVKQLSFDGVD